MYKIIPDEEASSEFSYCLFRDCFLLDVIDVESNSGVCAASFNLCRPPGLWSDKINICIFNVPQLFICKL